MKTDLVITSSSNPILKLARSLRQRKFREEEKLFLVEGIHHVGAAVEAGWALYAILYSEDVLGSNFAGQLIEVQDALGVKCVCLLPQLFASIAEKDNPQGILAIVHQRAIGMDELSTEKMQWGVAVVSPQDPGNVGTILRTIDAVGADGLFLLDGGVDGYHPSCVRASMGSLFWKPVVQASFKEFVTWAHSHGYSLAGSSAHAETDYRSLAQVEKPCFLILGNEQKGLTQEQAGVCDRMVKLPMHGHASSLNLSVAAGVLLYAMMEQDPSN
jgi:TrmH family RNA methyltransferase